MICFKNDINSWVNIWDDMVSILKERLMLSIYWLWMLRIVQTTLDQNCFHSISFPTSNVNLRVVSNHVENWLKATLAPLGIRCHILHLLSEQIFSILKWKSAWFSCKRIFKLVVLIKVLHIQNGIKGCNKGAKCLSTAHAWSTSWRDVGIVSTDVYLNII